MPATGDVLRLLGQLLAEAEGESGPANYPRPGGQAWAGPGEGSRLRNVPRTQQLGPLLGAPPQAPFLELTSRWPTDPPVVGTSPMAFNPDVALDPTGVEVLPRWAYNWGALPQAFTLPPAWEMGMAANQEGGPSQWFRGQRSLMQDYGRTRLPWPDPRDAAAWSFRQ